MDASSKRRTPARHSSKHKRGGRDVDPTTEKGSEVSKFFSDSDCVCVCVRVCVCVCV
jgi:hypothetical protein